MTEAAERTTRKTFGTKEPVPFRTQLKQNIVSAAVIGLCALALFSLLFAFVFGVPIAAVIYLLLIQLKFPMLGVIIVGSFFDKSRWWLAIATVSYLSCFLAPVFLGVIASLRRIAG